MQHKCGSIFVLSSHTHSYQFSAFNVFHSQSSETTSLLNKHEILFFRSNGMPLLNNHTYLFIKIFDVMQFPLLCTKHTVHNSRIPRKYGFVLRGHPLIWQWGSKNSEVWITLGSCNQNTLMYYFLTLRKETV